MSLWPTFSPLLSMMNISAIFPPAASFLVFRNFERSLPSTAPVRSPPPALASARQVLSSVSMSPSEIDACFSFCALIAETTAGSDSQPMTSCFINVSISGRNSFADAVSPNVTAAVNASVAMVFLNIPISLFLPLPSANHEVSNTE